MGIYDVCFMIHLQLVDAYFSYTLYIGFIEYVAPDCVDVFINVLNLGLSEPSFDIWGRQITLKESMLIVYHIEQQKIAHSS